MSWLVATPDGVVLRLHVQPGARRTEVVGRHGEALKIRLAAPPVDGKANACLLAFLAERLGVAKSQVLLVSGESSRAKRVKVGAGGTPDPAHVRQRLGVG
ncbi:MAG: YggU family protein [Gammaproteobacteria bacterium]|nr:YggU family protein [Gammaproteobacteria bacterium]MBU1645192.1 YggU family protein [Gammaproteobacteria bacterium]MBU1973429.1 YggU family protein [Gammaproteobacteria bacterium]